MEDDDTPANDGHCLVLAKEHYPTLFEISDETFAAVSRSVSKVARAVNQALSPQGLNLVQGKGPGAQQSMKHFHVHVLPRKLGNELNLNWGVRSSNRDTITALAEKIRASL